MSATKKAPSRKPAASGKAGAREPTSTPCRGVRNETVVDPGSKPGAPPISGHDLPMDRESLKVGVAGHIEYTQGKDEFTASPHDYYVAAARATRDRMFDRWNKTQQSYYRKNQRRVYYLSLEYLLGRLLEDSLLNLGIHDAMAGALSELGASVADLARTEPDAGLGNGGLGRLAACLLDSMATLGLAGTGYGIRYEYGIFEQQIVDGRQIERADNWLRYGSPWEVPRPEKRYLVRFGGKVAQKSDAAGRLVFEWNGDEQVWAMAYDYLVPGYRNDTVNTLRLWTAKATRDFSFDYFNGGDYIRAVEDKSSSENITRVLYPNDMVEQGRRLRLKQEYFFVSATIQDAIARHQKIHSSLGSFADNAVFQLNDTHLGIAVAELMRVLIDDYGFAWDEGWGITTRSIAYTNHTVLPEALETWPVTMLESILPRHLQIVFEINRRFLTEVRARFPGDEARVAILHVASLYLACRKAPPQHGVKRTFLFAGKAAPGYAAAKKIIELIHGVGLAIDCDPKVGQWLKVIFVPNYGVSLAELIVPAADLSEQISLAGTEASGTGNMKLALNGALTIGTADGANLELLDAFGARNFFQFGLTASEVEDVRMAGYSPQWMIAASTELRGTLDAVGKGEFSPDEPKRFEGLVEALLARDRFLVLADFESYRSRHRDVLDVWGDEVEWTRRSIMNTCNMGRFSSDEVIRAYARDIWKAEA